MRLEVLDRGHRLGTKALLGMIRLVTRQPVVDAVKLALYRPDFYGAGDLTHEAMRGPSDWSVGDRELMAAFVAQANESPFCVAAHSATSTQWYGDATKSQPLPLPIWTRRRSRSRSAPRSACSASSPASTRSMPTTSALCWLRAFPRSRSKTRWPVSGLRHHRPVGQCVRLRHGHPRRDGRRRAAPLETRLSIGTVVVVDACGPIVRSRRSLGDTLQR